MAISLFLVRFYIFNNLKKREEKLIFKQNHKQKHSHHCPGKCSEWLVSLKSLTDKHIMYPQFDKLLKSELG